MKSKKWVNVRKENLPVLSIHIKSHFYVLNTAIVTCSRKELKLEKF